MSEKKKVTKFSELQEPLLSDLLDETFVVEGYTSESHEKFGQRIVLTTDKGEYVTFSEVVLEQLQKVERQGAFPVEVTLRKHKAYYRFE